MEVAAWCRGAEGGGGAGGSRLDEGVGGRGRPEGHTHTHSGKSVLLYGGKSVLFDESEPQPFFFFFFPFQLYLTRQNYCIYANYPVQKFKYPWFVSFNTNDCFPPFK